MIRQWEGELMVVVCMPKLFVTNPLQAEMLVLERAVELCSELRMDNIIFEGDALVVVKAIKPHKSIVHGMDRL